MLRIALAVFAALCAAPLSHAQEKKPVRLFAEAEDFAPVGSGWKVLQDDLLVGSSLKDWDKDNSDSSSGGDEDGDDDE